MNCSLSLLLLCGLVALAAVEEQRPSLGIRVDLVPDPLSAPSGLGVVAVTAEGNGARLGLQVGDLIVAADGATIASAADLQEALAGKRAGEELRLTVQRAGEELILQGMLTVPVGARELAAREAAVGRSLDPADRDRYTLQDLLVILRQIERDLPTAAAEFKRIYPEGRFSIGIHIDIDSHVAPTEPVADPPP